MKKVFLFLAAGSLILASCVSNPEGQKAETTEVENVQEATGTPLAVNAAESSVVWTGKKVTGQHHGDIQLKSGTLFVDGGKLVGGDFVVDLNTINTQDLEGEYKMKLDSHLKSADFFAVEEHPEAVFEVTNVADGAEAGAVVVSGNLTIRGISKNITFNAQVEELTDASAKVSADFNIAREDWGVNYTGKADDLISKEINFKITLVAAAI